MIHIRPDGCPHHVGLNITITNNKYVKGIALAWAWYDNLTMRMTIRRISLRMPVRPLFVHGTHVYDVVENHLFIKGQVAVPQELLEDFVPEKYWPKHRDGHLD